MIVALGFAWLFHTSSGRQLLISKAEQEIGNAINYEVTIGDLGGTLPSNLVLRDLILADQDGAWLSVQRIDIDWHPMRLMQRNIDVSQLTVTGAYLLRSPVGDDQDRSDNQSINVRLPNDLPHVAIAQINLENFRSSLGAESVRLDGAGRLTMQDSMINTRLNMTSENNKDTVDIVLELSPDAETIFVDATLIAEVGGVIDAFTNLNGPLFVSAVGDSPTDDALVNINASLGEFGTIDGAISGNFAALNDISLSALFTSGSALSEIDALAQPVSLQSLFTQTADNAVLTLLESSSAIGAISGRLEWVDRQQPLTELKTDLEITFDEHYRADLQRFFGPNLSAQINLRQRRDDYGLTAEANAGDVAIKITDATTNLKNLFAGTINAAIAQSENAAFEIPDGTINSRFRIDLQRQASLSELTATFNDGSTIGGDATYSFSDETFTAVGNVSATPDFVERTGLSINPTSVVTGIYDLSGRLDNFAARFEIDVPTLVIGEGLAPPLSVIGAFVGLPRLPTGELVADNQAGQGQFKIATRSSLNGTVNIPELRYSGPSFQFSGSGLINPQTETLSVSANYVGQDGAAPWPGFLLIGEASIKGEYSVTGQKTNISVNAENLQADNISVSDLNLSAKGTPSNSNLEFSTSRILIPEIGETKNFNLDGTLNLLESMRLVLNNATGIFNDTSFRLTQPSLISFDDGISVEDFLLGWGNVGTISLNGSMTPQRWQAGLQLTDVNIPGADSIISLNLGLDTDEALAAEGNFKLQSLLTTSQKATITGNLLWDQTQLTLTSAGDNDVFDMRINLPAILSRNPTIKVETSGALNGYARYAGPISVIAAYLPPELQTFEGTLTSDFTLDGKTDDPKLSGTATLTDGAYTELRSGLSLAGIHVEADANYAASGSTIVFTGGARGAEQTEENTISLSGDMAIGETSDVNLLLRLTNASLSAFPVSTVLANGEINITGALDSLSANGTITIDELDAEIVTPENTGLVGIDVIAYNGEADDDLPIIEQPKSTIGYNISVSADDRIFIRGRGVESEWSADIDIENSNEEALITGAMILRRGSLDFSGRRFDLSTGRITFDRLSPNNPLLNIQAEHQTSDGVTAVITVSGRSESPSVTLTSTPALPSEDVMALVLFGKPAGELSALESLQTAQALASLGGIGPFGGAGGVTGSIREAIGLDLLNIDIDPQNGGGSLTVGKYVADGFFVSATQDAQGETGAVRVEYEITDNISIESKIQQDGDQTYSANWKRDF